MNASNTVAPEYRALVEQAGRLLAAGRGADAEQLLLRELAKKPSAADLLELVAEFYLETQRAGAAARLLTRCTEVEPARVSAYLGLATALAQLDRLPDIVVLFTRLTTVLPDLAIGHFNLAVFLRRVDRLEDAVLAYRRAIALRIDGAAEAWSNLGVVLGELGRHAEARAAFTQALAVDRFWIPALYNLGLLHEEFGERALAIELFQQALAIAPTYHDALVRIVHAQTLQSADDPLIQQVRAALSGADLAPAAREALSFALGKALDDCGRYDDAFAAFLAGNALAAARTKTYDRAVVEGVTRATTHSFDDSWLQRVQRVSTNRLLFVCGMFRSGTTLLEQMLGVHPALTPGGEIAYFNARLDDESAGYPRSVTAAEHATLTALGQGYLEFLERRFPGAQCVINKRPDTFRFLGLLHGLFPEARFVVMRRDPLDTSLSIFFEQLNEPFGYATSLDDIAHYSLRFDELLTHWKSLFPERILEVQYEQLVSEPEAQLRRVCAFLELPWHDGMLNFASSGDRVRTASVWQVRQPLHARSVGRWRHYAAHLDGVAKTLGIKLDSMNAGSNDAAR